MINIDSLIPRDQNGLIDPCIDKRAYMLTVCDNQARQMDKINALRDLAILCCGIANTANPDINTGLDTTTTFPFNMGRPQGGVNVFNPVFFPDADGNSTLQDFADKFDFTTCFMQLNLEVNICILTESLFFEEGGTPICIYPENIDNQPGNTINPVLSSGAEIEIVSAMQNAKTVKTFLEFDILCYGNVVDTVQVPVSALFANPGINCVTRQISIPIKYLSGSCDLNNLGIDLVPGSATSEYPLGSSEVRSVEINSASLIAECGQEDSCFIDLKRLVPRTGNCDDPRLFMLGYEHNNEVIANLIEQVRFTLARCCDTLDNQIFRTCNEEIVNPTPTQDVSLATETTDDSGETLENILNSQNLDECFLDFSGTYELCSNAQETNDGAIFPFSKFYTKRLDLICGSTLIETVYLDFEIFFQGDGLTVCESLPFSFEMNWDRATCGINDITILAYETTESADPFAVNTVIASERIVDLCIDSTCITFENPNN